MLWTLKGLGLLVGLGVVIGVSYTLFADGPKEESWRGWMLVPASLAILGELYLLIQWAGPAGGGG